MDPVAAFVTLFESGPHTGAAKGTAEELAFWKLKGGFIPTRQSIYDACARMGVGITPSHRLMLTLYGCL
jgi:hypothetical protein